VNRKLRLLVLIWILTLITLLLVLASPLRAAGDGCMSGPPPGGKYRLIGGRRCWYAPGHRDQPHRRRHRDRHPRPPVEDPKPPIGDQLPERAELPLLLPYAFNHPPPPFGGAALQPMLGALAPIEMPFR
jgi:hypothetical protein